MLHFLSETLDKDLEVAESIYEVFELVQTAVEKILGESRAGLNVGLMNIGNRNNDFLVAFYPAGSNIIVLNTTPLKRIEETNPGLFKPYLFHVLLHEYLHSLGYLDEPTVRKLTSHICAEAMGKSHIATQMANDIRKFFPSLVYPGGYSGDNRMKLIEDIDRGMDYIG